MSKHIELAKKLKALADKGEGGEKNNAENMLSDLLKKHKLTIEDIEGDQQHDYFFKLKKGEERLWGQIVSRVNRNIKKYGQFPTAKIKQYGLKGNYLITCTTAEYVEIESMFNTYQRLYEQEQEVFYTAFCYANDLLVSNTSAEDDAPLTREMYDEWMRVRRMSEGIKSETHRKQLR